MDNENDYWSNPISQTLTIELPESLIAQLEAEAHKQQTQVSTLIKEALEDYFAEDGEDDEEMEDTPKEQILAGLREALEDVKAGRIRPAEEVMQEIRRELEEERKIHAD